MGRAKNEKAIEGGNSRTEFNTDISVAVEEPVVKSKKVKVPGTAFTKSELKLYAQAIMDGSALKPGEPFAIQVEGPDQEPLANEMAKLAMKQGSPVELFFPLDTQSNAELIDSAGKVEQLRDDGAMFMTLRSSQQSEQTLSEDVQHAINLDREGRSDEANRIFEARHNAYIQIWGQQEAAEAEGDARWSLAACPTQDWAKKVYPELEPESAYRKLSEDLFKAARAHEGKDAMKNHLKKLKARSEAIMAMDVDEIRLQSEGTDLTMRVEQETKFMPVAWKANDGGEMCVNVPTDEVFTTPIADSVEGHFAITRPFVARDENGKEFVVTEAKGVFEKGKLVSIEGATPEETRVLKHNFNGASGTDMLGELGLVDSQGAVAKSGKTYYIDLLDEQAGVHVALGTSYSHVTGGAATANNDAQGHHDITIGGADMVVTAKSRAGKFYDLIKNGKWQV